MRIHVNPLTGERIITQNTGDNITLSRWVQLRSNTVSAPLPFAAPELRDLLWSGHVFMDLWTALVMAHARQLVTLLVLHPALHGAPATWPVESASSDSVATGLDETIPTPESVPPTLT
jgi:hypothetical protein